jgi:hypothetical protein
MKKNIKTFILVVSLLSLLIGNSLGKNKQINKKKYNFKRIQRKRKIRFKIKKKKY